MDVVIFPVLQLLLHDVAVEIAQVGVHHPVEAGVPAGGARPAGDLPVQEATLLNVEGANHQETQH